jgi:hypothetical protein
LRAEVAKATARALPATIKLWSRLSKHLIQGAAMSARSAARIEEEKRDDSSPRFDPEHRAYVMSAVVMAVSFLEATINELFAQAADGRLKGLNADATRRLSGCWGLEGFQTLSLLEKFNAAVLLTGNVPFTKGALPYQDVQLLVRLRNALVHYRPEWMTAASEADATVERRRLEKSLKGKFPINPLIAKGNPFWPDKCLGYGCAKWAVESAVKFADEFFSRMGLPSPHDDVRLHLNTQ